MYTATVVVNGRTFTVEVATTSAEIAAGLSGVAVLPPNTGMLFDMKSGQSAISINMDSMLFPLDITFISGGFLVLGTLWDVEPGDQDVEATFPVGDLARYFLEVNAGELAGVAPGTQVTITGYTPPTPVDMGSLVGMMITMMIVVMMMKMMMGTMKEVT